MTFKLKEIKLFKFLKLGIFGPFQKNIIPYLVTDSSSHSVNENPILDGSVPRMASEGVTG